MKRRRKHLVHPLDEVDDYEFVLLEQTRSRPGSWVSEEFRQHAIRWLAAAARRAKAKKGHPVLRQADRLRRQSHARQQRHEREAFYILLRARYFAELVSRSASGQPLKKSHSSKALIAEAAKKFGMRPKDVEFEMKPGVAGFYNAANDKWKEWVASITVPQTRILWAHRRGTKIPKIIHSRTQWTIDDATDRAAALAVRMIKGAIVGAEWPDARTKQMFAEFSEDTVRLHLQNHFAKLIKAAQR